MLSTALVSFIVCPTESCHGAASKLPPRLPRGKPVGRCTLARTHRKVTFINGLQSPALSESNFFKVTHFESFQKSLGAIASLVFRAEVGLSYA